MPTTREYYNLNAESFYKQTIDVDMEDLYRPFLSYLPKHAKILDLGCGSGRDTLAFKNQGYDVDAIDYSEELIKKASQFTGLKVIHQSFYDLSVKNKYHGIWACASLLHCERNRLFDVIHRIKAALLDQGVCYISFKYGDSDREKEGRQFTDLNEHQAEVLFNHFANIQILQQWITTDRRPDRDEKWLNILFKKT